MTEKEFGEMLKNYLKDNIEFNIQMFTGKYGRSYTHMEIRIDGEVMFEKIVDNYGNECDNNDVWGE